MNNYYKSSKVDEFLREQGYIPSTNIELAINNKQNFAWYCKAYNSKQFGNREVHVLVTCKNAILNEHYSSLGYRQVKENEAFVINDIYQQYIHCKPIKYAKNKRGYNMVKTKAEILEARDLSALNYSKATYNCYAVMQNNICVNLLWGAGSQQNLEHIVFVSDCKMYDPKIHTLRQIKPDEYVRCHNIEQGDFSYDSKGLFRISKSLLNKVAYGKKIEWI